MKKLARISLFISLFGTLLMPVFAQKTQTASAATLWEGKATGYTKASDVEYTTNGKYVLNWGARDETCTFLTSYATSFYTGSYSYEQMSLNAGSSQTSSVPNSSLYKALKQMVTNEQTYTTSYDATTSLFRYTDCVNSDSSYISSFYSGNRISGTWDSGKTWNREHTWPNSKGDANGKGENDIMMLRPTATSENGSRGNKAYGESGSFYDPNSEGQNVRGDCARIILYVYTRWATQNMWGSSGVMESKDILLKWMEEDPVDTWEMGRNDATEAITGTRNVYVDYPEYAWLLFGEAAPTDMVTPSGKASGGTAVPVPPSEDDSQDQPNVPSTPTTPTEIVNAAYELATGETLEGTYTLTGKVTNVKEYDSETTNICLTFAVEGLEDKPIYCYWMRDNANGDNKNLKVGDCITVTGTIKNHKDTVEFDKPNLVSVGATNTPSTPTNPDTPNVPVKPTTPNTQKEVVNAAYALAVGETLDGTYSLTGKVTNVKEYDKDSTNICLTIVVNGLEDKPIYCFWMRDNASGDNKNIVVGDTITVTGILKNYKGTVEFDKPTLDSVEGKEAPTTPDSSKDTDSSFLSGCQASVGVSMAGIALVAMGAMLFKRKNENE